MPQTSKYSALHEGVLTIFHLSQTVEMLHYYGSRAHKDHISVKLFLGASFLTDEPEGPSTQTS